MDFLFELIGDLMPFLIGIGALIIKFSKKKKTEKRTFKPEDIKKAFEGSNRTLEKTFEQVSQKRKAMAEQRADHDPQVNKPTSHFEEKIEPIIVTTETNEIKSIDLKSSSKSGASDRAKKSRSGSLKKKQLRQAIIYSEVLGKPKALR